MPVLVSKRRGICWKDDSVLTGLYDPSRGPVLGSQYLFEMAHYCSSLQSWASDALLWALWTLNSCIYVLTDIHTYT